MPTIRVSEEVDEEIRRRGGFGDTHDSVLRRVLGLSDKTSDNFAVRRAPHGSVTGTKTYRPIILKALLAAPKHTMHAAAVIGKVGERMHGQFTEFDLQATSSGAVRWQNKVQWARDELVKEQLLEPVEIAGRGVWRLTTKGLTAARILKGD